MPRWGARATFSGGTGQATPQEILAQLKRFVLSIKSECLRRMIFFGEGSLRRAIREYLVHYHVERAHQGIGDERIERVRAMGEGAVQCTERLGGLLKCYRRAA